jgi:hypothetical protein
MVTIRGLCGVLLGMLIGFLLAILGGILASRSTQAWSRVPVQTPATGVPDPDPDTSVLRIECRNDDRCVKTSEADWKDGQGALKRKFLRVLVYNDSPETAEACMVLLRSVSVVTQDGVTPSGYDAPGLLIWSGEGSARKRGWDVPPGPQPGVADLLFTVHRPTGDLLVLKDEGYGSFLKLNTTYRFRLVVTAEGVGAVYKSVVVRFGTAWDDFEVLSE